MSFERCLMIALSRDTFKPSNAGSIGAGIYTGLMNTLSSLE